MTLHTIMWSCKMCAQVQQTSWVDEDEMPMVSCTIHPGMPMNRIRSIDTELDPGALVP